MFRVTDRVTGLTILLGLVLCRVILFPTLTVRSKQTDVVRQVVLGR